MISSNHHQTHSVGRTTSAKGFTTRVVLLLLFTQSIQGTLYNDPLNIDDLMDFFGSNGCIEGGTLMATITQTVPIVSSDSHVSAGEIQNDTIRTQTLEVTSSSDAMNVGKEKTPMCLVNELARYNKIEHQYRLTSENGPPHKKMFTVTLKLGVEEYTAEGASIKKAQHAAAGIALKNTKYNHPPPKSSRNQRAGKGNITPTVELNALAMKRGEPTIYTLLESPHASYGHVNYYQRMYPQHYGENVGFSYPRVKLPQSYRLPYGNYNHHVDQRYYGGKPPAFKVMVKVGEREFMGEGPSAQAARHDAASKALEQLRDLPVELTCPAQPTTCDGVMDPDSSSELKSPISLVHEMALKRNLSVVFDVVSEKGPPHMRTFVTRCAVDKFETTGEGNGKKVSKKRAAEKMLDILRSLPLTSTVAPTGCPGSLGKLKKRSNAPKKKSRNLIKDTNIVTNQDQKYEADLAEDINPISRLIQIQQAKKEREPVYTLREERGVARKREFFMEVTVGDHSYIGSGPNKKIAKRNAAEGMLQLLGYSSSTLSRAGHTISQHPNKVRFSDEKQNSGGGIGGVSGRQLVPGLLLMNDNKTPSNGVNMKTSAVIAKEYLSNGNSPTADALAGQKRVKSSPAVRPTEQLLYLAQVLNFKVQFSDFPKGNHNEFLSLVTLATDPPQVCHGAGSTTELSHDQAALSALRCLSEMGLDSVTPTKLDPASGLPQPTAEGMYMGLSNSISKDESYVNGK